MATTTSSTSPTLSSPGVGSGLDVAGIVSKLMTVEKRPLTLMDAQISASQAKVSAYGTLKSALATLQGSLAGLGKATSFRALAATVSDPAMMTATVGDNAVAGSYAVEVTGLAQAQKLATAGFASLTDVVGTGTLTFDLGTFDGVGFTANGKGARTVTIAAGQNSLAGIRDAVNAANLGVTATIVNDGNANGNHLVFTVTTTGAANSLRITAGDADGNATDSAGLSQLAFDPATTAGNGRNLEQKVAAKDATLVIDGITVHRSTNTVTDAIQGVTLNLLHTNVDTPATVSIAANTKSVSTLVESFVTAYNQLQTTLGNLTKYDAAQKRASVLTGDGTVRQIQTQLRSILGSSLPSGAFTTLSQAGVQFKADGTLALDSAKLDTALHANPAAVTQLFAAVGTATDALASVGAFGAKTVPGTYALNVTQLARQGSLTGSASAGLTITAGVNDQLDVTIDGASTSVTLAAGTYANAASLAAEVQGKINGASAYASTGTSVSVTQSGGALTIASNRYGSVAAVAVAGNAAAALMGAAPVATVGIDVAGTIGGIAALGSGQALVGSSGTPSEGLRIVVSGGALGDRGSVTFGQGFAYRLDRLVAQATAGDGAIATRTTGLQKTIADVQKREDAFNRRMTQLEANYLRQFNALDTLLSSLSAQSTALAQQLDTLKKNSST